MSLNSWIKIAFAGPLLLFRIGEMAASSWFVVAQRSRRLAAANCPPNASDRREFTRMVQEKFAGGLQSNVASLRFLAAELTKESRRSSSALSYLNSSARSLWSSRTLTELTTRAFVIALKLSFLMFKQPLRIGLFLIDWISNALAPLQRRVISNATRLMPHS